jgi:hypothetical protein
MVAPPPEPSILPPRVPERLDDEELLTGDAAAAVLRPPLSAGWQHIREPANL